LKKRFQSWIKAKKTCQDSEKTETDLKTPEQNSTEPEQYQNSDSLTATVQAVPVKENSDDLSNILTYGIDPKELFGESYNVSNKSADTGPEPSGTGLAEYDSFIQRCGTLQPIIKPKATSKP